jgi:hypothetical protein
MDITEDQNPFPTARLCTVRGSDVHRYIMDAPSSLPGEEAFVIVGSFDKVVNETEFYSYRGEHIAPADIALLDSYIWNSTRVVPLTDDIDSDDHRTDVEMAATGRTRFSWSDWEDANRTDANS